MREKNTVKQRMDIPSLKLKEYHAKHLICDKMMAKKRLFDCFTVDALQVPDAF